MNQLVQKAWSGFAKFIIALMILILLPAWTIHFWQAWVFLLVFALSMLFITTYLIKNDPALLERRMKVGPGTEQEKNQKKIQAVASISLVTSYIVAGLDHHFHWSYVPAFLSIVANVFVLTGFIIIFFVFRENSFTSGIIEIDKDQKVVTTGPYRMVRHPMYSGASLLFISAPLALGSWWALIPGFLLIMTMIIRLLDEEKFLSVNLRGYKEYCIHTPYRLIPFVW